MRRWFSRHSSYWWPRLSQFQHLSGFRCIVSTLFGCISSPSPSSWDTNGLVTKLLFRGCNLISLQNCSCVRNSSSNRAGVLVPKCINSNLSEVLECLISKRNKDSSVIGFRSRATSLSTWNWNSSNGSLSPCLLLWTPKHPCLYEYLRISYETLRKNLTKWSWGLPYETSNTIQWWKPIQSA